MGSLSTIFVDFVARTAGFQQGVQDATRSLKQGANDMDRSFSLMRNSGDQMTSAVERAGLKISASFLGARTVAMALSNEIKDVYKNIDNIPGISQDTIESVNRMKYSFSLFKTMIDQIVALGLAKLSNSIEAVGYAYGSMAYGADAVAEAFDKMNQEAAAFASKDFDKQFAKLTTEFDRLKLTAGGMASALLADAAAMAKFADSTNGTQQERWDAALEAMRDKIEAQKALNKLRQDYDRLMSSADTIEEKYGVSVMGTARAISFLKDKVKELQLEEDSVIGADWNRFMGDPAALEKFNEIQKKINESMKLLNEQFVKAEAPVKKIISLLGNDLDSAMADSLNHGADAWKRFGATVGLELEKMALRIMVIKPLFESLSGVASGLGFATIAKAFMSYAGAMAGGGTIGGGQFALVGENGPELLASPGTVVSNDRIAAAVGGGAGGGTNVTYNIGSGVTRQELMSLMPKLISSTKAAVSDAYRRGGAYRNAFS